MRLAFTKWSPAGNTTLLISSPLEPQLRPSVASYLMSPEGLCAEQVGFLDGGTLHMAGGEFCGNATRCLGALWALDSGQRGEQTWDVSVSALDRPLTVRTRAKGEGLFDVEVELPPLPTPERLVLTDEEGNQFVVWRVVCPGIVHYLFRHSRDERVVSLVENYRHQQGEVSAFGVDFYVEEAGLFWPLVVVPGVSRMWERSCASGTAALARLYATEGKTSGLVRQPGGELSYQVDGPIVTLGGGVSLVARGEVFVPDFIHL